MRRVWVRLVLWSGWVATICAYAAPAGAAPILLERLHGPGDLAPGGGGARFTSVLPQSYDAPDRYTFVGWTGTQSALYARLPGSAAPIKVTPLPFNPAGDTNSVVEVVASRAMPDGQNVAFVGGFRDPPNRYILNKAGLFNSGDGAFTRLADTFRNTPMPGGTTPIGGFETGLGAGRDRVILPMSGVYDPARNFTDWALVAASPSGTLMRLLDTTSAVPGSPPGTKFGIFQHVNADGDDYAVGAYTSAGFGVFANVNGTLVKVADEDQDVPGRAGQKYENLSYSSVPIRDGAVVVNNGDKGLYLWRDGRMTRVVDTDMAAPGGDGNFSSIFYEVLGDDGQVAFTADDSSGGFNRAVYTTLGGGGLTRVLGSGDVIDGQRVYVARTIGMSGNQVAMEVSFDTGGGLYVATIVPEPATGAVVLGAAAATLLARRRRPRVARMGGVTAP